MSFTVSAQSIGHVHIGDNICQKNEIKKKYFLLQKKGVIQHQILEKMAFCEYTLSGLNIFTQAFLKQSHYFKMVKFTKKAGGNRNKK
jgi:hypothetical protein